MKKSYFLKGRILTKFMGVFFLLVVSLLLVSNITQAQNACPEGALVCNSSIFPSENIGEGVNDEGREILPATSGLYNPLWNVFMGLLILGGLTWSLVRKNRKG